MFVRLSLVPSPVPLAICRLPAGAEVPAWAARASFCSVTRSYDEVALVVSEEALPQRQEASRGWRAIRIEGPDSPAHAGVLASVVGPLARVRVSVFAIATGDADYVLVHAPQVEQALAALEAAGHRIAAPARG